MNRVQIKFVKDALGRPESLTDWENQFINDLAERGDDYALSEKQNAILNRIQGKLS